jgi:hypothetical protein
MLISREGALTVNLRKVSGEVLWTRVLEPEPVRTSRA